MGSMSRKLRRYLEQASMKHPESKWREILYDISDWFYYRFVSRPRQLKKSLERVIGWIPIVWKNYDWDYHYMFEVMRYKLERMEKCIRVHGHHVGMDQTADSIRHAKLVLDRICERDYLNNALKGHDERWGDVSMGWEPVSKMTSRLKWAYERDLSDKQKEQERREFRKCGEHADYMEKQDIEYLFKYIKKHHKKWWD